MRELSFRGKPESENSRFVENENLRILVLWKTRIREFSFCGKRESPFFFYPRIPVLWKTRIGEFFFYPRIFVLWKTGTGEFSFCGKPESENFFSFFIREFSFCGKRELENSRLVENQNRTILVLWKTRHREFSFCGKREFQNLWKTRILVLWKTRIREFWFCGKRELEKSRFVENENPTFLVFWRT